MIAPFYGMVFGLNILLKNLSSNMKLMRHRKKRSEPWENVKEKASAAGTCALPSRPAH